MSIMVACITACSHDDYATDDVGGKEVTTECIAFNVTGVSEITSRGNAVTVSELQTVGEFGAYAYYDKNGSVDYANAYFQNASVSYFENTWRSTYTWPSEKLYFYCYYPKATETQGTHGVSITSNTTNGPIIGYSAPTTVENQPDLLVCKTNATGINDSPEVSVQFSHILAGVRFAIGDNCKTGITIKSITLTGVQDSATYYMKNDTWMSPSKKRTKSYTITLTSPRAVEDDDVTNHTLISAENIFLVPQTLTSADSIKVYYEDYGGEMVASAALSDLSITAGNRYTYQLSVHEFTIEGTEQYGHLTIYSDYSAMDEEKYDIARILDTFEGDENEQYDKGSGNGTSTGDEQYNDGTEDHSGTGNEKYNDGTEDHSGTGNEKYNDGTEDGKGESTEGYGYEDLKQTK